MQIVIFLAPFDGSMNIEILLSVHLNVSLRRDRIYSLNFYQKCCQNRAFVLVHSKKRTTCSGLMKTALNNVVLPTLFKVVNNTEQVDEPELACSQV